MLNIDTVPVFKKSTSLLKQYQSLKRLVLRETVHFVFRESQCYPRMYILLYSTMKTFKELVSNGGRRSKFADNSSLLLPDVIDLAMLPARETFGGKQLGDLEVANESARC